MGAGLRVQVESLRADLWAAPVLVNSFGSVSTSAASMLVVASAVVAVLPNLVSPPAPEFLPVKHSEGKGEGYYGGTFELVLLYPRGG